MKTLCKVLFLLIIMVLCGTGALLIPQHWTIPYFFLCVLIGFLSGIAANLIID
jgi:hypothetical protein